jgi:hypothetical protein
VEFKRRVRKLSETSSPGFRHSRVYESDTFLFASHNLAEAITHVNTTFLFVLQHDYQLVRPFDAAGLLRSMLALPVIKHVRLNMRPNSPARGFDGVVENASIPGLRVPLTRTCGWSDAPHIARTDYYRHFVIPRNRGDHNGGRRKFMEESLHYPMQRNFLKGGCWELKQKTKQGVRPLVWPSDFDDYGTYLYGTTAPGDGSYTRHRSLRGNAPQWGLDHRPKEDIAKGMAKGRGAVGAALSARSLSTPARKREALGNGVHGRGGRGGRAGTRGAGRGRGTGGRSTGSSRAAHKDRSAAVGAIAR